MCGCSCFQCPECDVSVTCNFTLGGHLTQAKISMRLLEFYLPLISVKLMCDTILTPLTLALFVPSCCRCLRTAAPTPPSSGSSTRSSPSSTSSAPATSGLSSRSCWLCCSSSWWDSSSTACLATWSRSFWGHEVTRDWAVGPSCVPLLPLLLLVCISSVVYLFSKDGGKGGEQGRGEGGRGGCRNGPPKLHLPLGQRRRPSGHRVFVVSPPGWEPSSFLSSSGCLDCQPGSNDRTLALCGVLCLVRTGPVCPGMRLPPGQEPWDTPQTFKSKELLESLEG